MGILRDTIKSAIAPDTVNNGLGGAKLPFTSSGQSNQYVPTYRSNQRSPFSRQREESDHVGPQYYDIPRTSRGAVRSSYQSPKESFYSHRNASYSGDIDLSTYENADRGFASRPRTISSSPRRTYRSSSPNYGVKASRDGLDPYSVDNQSGRRHDQVCKDSLLSPQTFDMYEPPPTYSRGPMRFRPFIVPQIAFGSGQPFLRAYSDELSTYGISQRDFVSILDSVNVANTPNPENQIFQKGANIAGWFVPGAAGIALMGGQLVTGVGAAYGHMSAVAKVLSKANMDIFLPAGLEICICSTQHIEAELECGHPSSDFNARPEQRARAYGELTAALTRVLPPLQGAGRHDALAGVARGLMNMSSTKALQKAQKDAAKGKNKKSMSLENDLKWIMVRRASPEALTFLESSHHSASENSYC